MLTPRAHSTIDRLVVDMLLLQGLKSDGTILLLAQHGLMEDTATIARRLMELSVTAVYIGAESDTKVRRQRAGMYLAFMWRKMPDKVRTRLPLQSRRRWSAIARRYDHFVPKKAQRWGPNWSDMFKEIGAEEMYREDYSFLSSIAHGSPDNQLFTFAGRTIRVHNDQFASVLLIFATRYFLAIVEQWNLRYRLVDQTKFKQWVVRAATDDFSPEAV